MAKKPSGLGKGLGALMLENATDEMVSSNTLPLNEIMPNKDQPRKTFDENSLAELAESIKQHGVLQPLLVRPLPAGGYQLVAGERRWRASRMAGVKDVPVVIKELTDTETMEIAIIENLQREDLNPIEEASAYKRLLSEFKMTQDVLAEKIGKNRTTITNSMRLLNLDENVQNMIIDEKLTPGHARALLTIEDKAKQYQVAQKVFDEKLSVRDTEKLVKSFGKPKKEKKLTPEALQLIYRKLEDKLRESVGAKVEINAKDTQKGTIEIEYFSQDELEEIVNKITSKREK